MVRSVSASDRSSYPDPVVYTFSPKIRAGCASLVHDSWAFSRGTVIGVLPAGVLVT